MENSSKQFFYYPGTERNNKPKIQLQTFAASKIAVFDLDLDMEELNAQEETLQKLERLTNLETMVAEQRIRIEKYRTMYETLKAEHVQIEDVKSRRENELIALQDEVQVMQKKFQDVLNQTRTDCDRKTQECEELRMQILTPQKMEVLRVKLQEEAEASYKHKLETADLELDKYRSDFNKLRYEYSFLKSEYEHEQAKNKTIIEEQKVHHQIEVDAIMKDKDDLLEHLKKLEDQNDTQRIRVLQKDNAQLNLKVKSLLDELDEIREKREATGLQSDHVSRLQARQLSEISAHCKALETEKEALKTQLDRLQAELERSNKQQELFSHQAMKFERENLQLKSNMDELLHNHKVEINNIKLSLTKDRGELERERDAVQSELQTNKNKIIVLTQNMEELKNTLSRKEEEIVQRVQAVKEQEWEKISTLENYKIQVESQLADNDRQRVELEASYKQQIEKMDGRLNSTIESRDKFERELNSTKSQILHQRQQNDQLEEAKRQNQEWKTKHQNLMNECERLKTSEEETKSANEKLNDNIDLLKKELKLIQEDIRQQQEVFQKGVQEAKKKIETERKEHEKDAKSLKKKLQQSEQKSEKMSLMAKKKLKKQNKIIEDLNKQLEVHKAQRERNEVEKNALTKNLNLEHERTKRMLERLRKKQNQFNHLLHASTVGGIPNIAISSMNQSPLLGMSFEQGKESTKFPLDSLDPLPVPNADDLINGTLHTRLSTN
eukprot:gene5390-6063_t